MIRTSDIVALAVHDFGGAGDRVLLLVHAAGFHGRVLGPLAGSVASAFHCVAPDLRGHGASGLPPGGEVSWDGMAEDLLAVVDGLGLDRPFGFGHSAGGTALLLAEQRRPGTFAALYCYEPLIVAADPPLGRDPDNWQAASVRRRRSEFPSRSAALAACAARRSWARMAPEVLAAYVDFGFADEGDGGRVTARCHPETEARLYESATEHHAFPHLRRVACPVVVARGDRSDAFAVSLATQMADRLRFPSLVVVPGLGHLGPLESPGAVGASLLATLPPVGDGAPAGGAA